MYEYDEECLKTFLKKQGQLFDEPVAETLEEAEAFLEDCMAVIADSLDEVKSYLEEEGMDIDGMSADEILEKLPSLLLLSEAETEEMYDLAARSRHTVSADLPEYIMEKDIVRAALRTAKKHNVTDKQWEDFIRRITKESD